MKTVPLWKIPINGYFKDPYMGKHSPLFQRISEPASCIDFIEISEDKRIYTANEATQVIPVNSPLKRQIFMPQNSSE